MSIFNVDYHMRRLRSHFGVRNRVQLAAAATLLRPAAPLPGHPAAAATAAAAAAGDAAPAIITDHRAAALAG